MYELSVKVSAATSLNFWGKRNEKLDQENNILIWENT
jgi:hypothetical protein